MEGRLTHTHQALPLSLPTPLVHTVAGPEGAAFEAGRAQHSTQSQASVLELQDPWHPTKLQASRGGRGACATAWSCKPHTHPPHHRHQGETEG
eukprot:scaffold78917_cov33-Tisochrysis_lutea.AAC.12